MCTCDTHAKTASGALAKGTGPTIESEIKRFHDFAQNAQVTNRPQIFLGAPALNDPESYGIGYVDNDGRKRVFVVHVDNAEAMAHDMLQEIAHAKLSRRRKKVISVLENRHRQIASGGDIDDVVDCLQSDLSDI